MSIQNLSEFTFYSRYSQYDQEKGRRETWEEAVNRVFQMHETKYENILKENETLRQHFDFAKSQVVKKRVLGSQRSLQYGGEPTLKRNERLFNCSSLYIDKPKAFQDVVWLLLAGCGVGFSVQKHHISKLPKIQKTGDEEKVYQIPDSCEGWANAVGVLLASYFENGGEFKEYKGKKVVFDYSLIREKGALIAGKFKAPGPKPLEIGLEKIRKLLNSQFENKNSVSLRSLVCYDILMVSSDFVISGGLRRSATICLFSEDDQEMMNAKTGNWFIDNPQRARSNNSVVLKRDETKKQDFRKIFESIKEYGEPGFLFVDDLEELVNPCLPKWSKILTKNGIKELSDVTVEDEIWSKEGWTKIINKWSTGVKKVYEYKTTGGTFYSTDNHRVVSNGEKIQVKDADSIDTLTGEYQNGCTLNPKIIMDGIVFGDGAFHKASNNLVYLCIGENDHDYFKSEVKELIIKHRPGLSDYAYIVDTSIIADEIPKTYERSVPIRYKYGNKNTICSFLRGLYTANGSLAGGRVSLKAASFDVIKDVQLMLSSVGIRSYYTTNKSKQNKFSNGVYTMKESYDLNITSDKDKFYNSIGFIQEYKDESLRELVERKSNREAKKTFDIKEVSLISEEEVFDITVDNSSHTFWCDGFDISNCVEIKFYNHDELTKETGVGFCNLCEINGKYTDSEEKFLKACRAASIIGTLQAGYTDFPYLGEATENIVRRDSLLGVSITGWMDNPDILFSPEILRKGAEECKRINKEISEIIGINKASRITCAKPAGHTSCILGTASGIHPHHAKRYIRRVQCNKDEFALAAFKTQNPMAVEHSVWSSNGTDDVVSFLCEVPQGAITKNQIGAVELLEKVKIAQSNWVHYGINEDKNYPKDLTHNISNTITVKDDEWEDVCDFIFENKGYFSGISLLPASGDLDYPQAPFSTVLTPQEMVREFGDASIFASGLVVDGLSAFNNNLWNACASAMGLGEAMEENVEEPSYPSSRNYKELSSYFVQKEKYEEWFLKKDWIRRLRQFADRYFEGDTKKTIHCLKYTYLWKVWVDLKREYSAVDWTKFKEEGPEYQEADQQAAVACSGGKCEISF
jgi:hypothetical protein